MSWASSEGLRSFLGVGEFEIGFYWIALAVLEVNLAGLKLTENWYMPGWLTS